MIEGMFVGLTQEMSEAGKAAFAKMRER